jgi:hypothetical protein
MRPVERNYLKTDAFDVLQDLAILAYRAAVPDLKRNP